MGENRGQIQEESTANLILTETKLATNLAGGKLS